MRDSDDLQQGSVASGGGNVIALFLALYLLVLAFFIVLVSISSIEEVRSKAVMDSLTSTFASLMPPTTELTAFTTLEGDVLAGQKFQEEITNIFASAIQVVDINVMQPGREMRIRMPADVLFVPGEPGVRPNLLPMLDRAVAAMGSPTAGMRHDMELVLGSDAVERDILPIGQTLALARVGAFGREMITRGAPPTSVTVGLQPGHPDVVTLWFFVRSADEGGMPFNAETTARKPDERAAENGNGR